MTPALPKVRDLVWKVVDGEAIILDLETGDHFSLNPVATAIWELLQERLGADEVARRVADRYRKPVESVRSDVDELLAELLETRLWRPE